MLSFSSWQKLSGEIAEVAGPIARRYFQSGESTKLKADATPVTEADTRIEGEIRTLLRNRFPDVGIVGEEFGSQAAESEYCWYIDPIDGTQSFVHGVPLFATLVGLVHRDQPILGLIYQPILNELLIGDGRKALYQGRLCQAKEKQLAESTLLCTDWATVSNYHSGGGFDKLAHSVRLCRTWGDAYGYLMLATGRAQIMIDPVVNPWDYLPLLPVLWGAGLAVSDYSGRQKLPWESTVASTPNLHRQVIEILQE